MSEQYVVTSKCIGGRVLDVALLSLFFKNSSYLSRFNVASYILYVHVAVSENIGCGKYHTPHDRYTQSAKSQSLFVNGLRFSMRGF